MDPDFWLELESTYIDRLAQRKALYAQHTKKVIDIRPGSSSSDDALATERACVEILHMAISFLCARYPNHFIYSSRTGKLHNKILQRIFDVPFVGDSWGEGGVRALEVLLDNVPEDFLITLPNAQTGIYHMRAGVSCSAVGWTMQDKIGKPLSEIHGPVPDYKEKMEFSMDRCAQSMVYRLSHHRLLTGKLSSRYFTKMPLDKPIQRGSWGLEIGQPLFCEPSDPHLSLRSTQSPTLTPHDIHLRVDWQTLRRLPSSRAIVFNFKALFTPMEEFRDEPYIPALVAKILKEAKGNLLEYKGTWHVQHVVVPVLEAWAKEQEEKGMVEKGWRVRTLDEDPYFPGWERKWRA